LPQHLTSTFGARQRVSGFLAVVHAVEHGGGILLQLDCSPVSFDLTRLGLLARALASSTD
jgi:hypothetical protein